MPCLFQLFHIAAYFGLLWKIIYLFFFCFSLYVRSTSFIFMIYPIWLSDFIFTHSIIRSHNSIYSFNFIFLFVIHIAILYYSPSSRSQNICIWNGFRVSSQIIDSDLLLLLLLLFGISPNLSQSAALVHLPHPFP